MAARPQKATSAAAVVLVANGGMPMGDHCGMWIPKWPGRLRPGEKTFVALVREPFGSQKEAVLGHDHFVSSPSSTKPYTVASTAPRAAIDAAHRGALTALRDELDILCVEVEVDQPWPADVAWAVEALRPRHAGRRTLLTRRPKLTEISDDLYPADDHDFAIALAVVRYTTFATGFTHDGHVVYSTYDGLYEDYFVLTEAEHALAAGYMAAHGADPGLLIQDPA
jgi:hypothetical protein